ncbi:MAG: hypothetical protein AAF629_19085 [Chloroflexota bacterium]
MLKNTVVRFMVAFSLVIALTAGSSIVGDQLGLGVTAQVEAGSCSGGAAGGGGC